jgi:hypothetical protein
VSTTDRADQLERQDINAILAQAQRPTQPYRLCLRDDLRQRHRRLEEDLAAAMREAPATMGEQAKTRQLAEQIRKLEEQMDTESLHLLLQALPPGRYRELLREHPPRQNDPVDRHQGFNVDSFIPELLKESISRPVLSPAQMQQAITACSDGQLMDWAGACITLNQEAMSVPFSPAASRLTQGSGSE